MIVVDTNIIGYLYLSGKRSGQSEELLKKDSGWCAPVLWRSEFQNVLATHFHQERLKLEDALQIAKEADSLMEGREFEVTSSAVLRLAAASGCSAYDCEFVALAMDLDVPLITVDKQILKRFPDVAIELGKY